MHLNIVMLRVCWQPCFRHIEGCLVMLQCIRHFVTSGLFAWIAAAFSKADFDDVHQAIDSLCIIAAIHWFFSLYILPMYIEQLLLMSHPNSLA